MLNNSAHSPNDSKDVSETVLVCVKILVGLCTSEKGMLQFHKCCFAKVPKPKVFLDQHRVIQIENAFKEYRFERSIVQAISRKWPLYTMSIYNANNTNSTHSYFPYSILIIYMLLARGDHCVGDCILMILNLSKLNIGSSH